MKNNNKKSIALTIVAVLMISGCIDVLNRDNITFEVYEIREEMVKCRTGSSKKYLIKTNNTNMIVVCNTCGNRDCSEVTSLKKGDKATLKANCMDREWFEEKIVWQCVVW